MATMQTDSTVLLHENENIASTFLTQAIDVQQIEGFSFQLLWSGGTGFTAIATIEGSNDLNKIESARIFNTVDRSPEPLICDSGSHVYDADNFHYRYMRLRIEVSVDSANFDIYFNSRSRRN